VQMADETLRGLGASSWSVVTVAPPQAVATATVIRVVAGSSRGQGQERRRPRQKQPDLGRGDCAGDDRGAGGGG
jgi:hypothetical protein